MPKVITAKEWNRRAMRPPPHWTDVAAYCRWRYARKRLGLPTRVLRKKTRAEKMEWRRNYMREYRKGNAA